MIIKKMGERPFKIVEIGYLHILLAGYLVSVLCIKAVLGKSCVQ